MEIDIYICIFQIISDKELIWEPGIYGEIGNTYLQISSQAGSLKNLNQNT